MMMMMMMTLIMVIWQYQQQQHMCRVKQLTTHVLTSTYDQQCMQVENNLTSVSDI